MITRRVRTATATVLAVVAITLAFAPAAAIAAPAAQLSVTLTNSQKTVTAGDKVIFTGKVKNLGVANTDVKVVLAAPAYVTLGMSDDARVQKNDATWTTSIGAGKTSKFTIHATIGKIPNTERRVTTLASVYVGDNASPVVRTANASFITGVKDTPGGKVTTTPATAHRSDTPIALVPWLIAGGVLVVLFIAAVIFLRVRRRQRQRTHDLLT